MTSTTKRGFHLPWGSGTDSTDLDDSFATDGVDDGSDGGGDGDNTDESRDQLRSGADQSSTNLSRNGRPAATAWPEVDRAGAATMTTESVERQRSVTEDAEEPREPREPRRNNALVAGLVRAMRDAARGTREETTTRMQAAAEARIEEIRTDGAAEAIELRKRADDDISTIREWSKAEMARVREETDRRIAERRTLLGTEAESQTGEIERMVEGVKAAAARFEAEMEQFFTVLLAEEDPARLATLAERVPDAPTFEKPTSRSRSKHTDPTGATNRTKPTTDRPAKRATSADGSSDSDAEAGDELVARLAPDAAAAAEAAAMAELDLEPEPGATDESAAAGAGNGSGTLANVLATAPRIDSPSDVSEDDREALLGVDRDESDVDPNGTEPQSDRATRVVVTGLTSVAGISRFKSALGRVPGVVSVNVTSGTADDFIFTVSHAPATDLPAAIDGFADFAAQMTGDDAGVVSFEVVEPGA
jgi:hypothetical protein